MKLFPVLRQRSLGGNKWFPSKAPSAIDWTLLEPYRPAIQTFHGQSLERLAERGGLSPCELKLHVVHGSDYKTTEWKDAKAAEAWLLQWLAENKKET